MTNINSEIHQSVGNVLSTIYQAIHTNIDLEIINEDIWDDSYANLYAAIKENTIYSPRF